MTGIQYVGLVETDSKGEMMYSKEKLFQCHFAHHQPRHHARSEQHWYKMLSVNRIRCVYALHSEPNFSIQLLILVMHNEQDALQFKMCSAHKIHEVLMKHSSNKQIQRLKYFLTRYLNSDAIYS